MGNAATTSPVRTRATVHPHGCGERHSRGQAITVTLGSSPRLWGTLKNAIGVIVQQRFIPTAVGNAQHYRPGWNFRSVHPHGCGERRPDKFTEPSNNGSSPRLWGTPVTDASRALQNRFIPTAVGNAEIPSDPLLVATVHPHGCGERPIRRWQSSS